MVPFVSKIFSRDDRNLVYRVLQESSQAEIYEDKSRDGGGLGIGQPLTIHRSGNFEHNSRKAKTFLHAEIICGLEKMQERHAINPVKRFPRKSYKPSSLEREIYGPIRQLPTMINAEYINAEPLLPHGPKNGFYEL